MTDAQRTLARFLDVNNHMLYWAEGKGREGHWLELFQIIIRSVEGFLVLSCSSSRRGGYIQHATACTRFLPARSQQAQAIAGGRRPEGGGGWRGKKKKKKKKKIERYTPVKIRLDTPSFETWWGI